MGEILNVKRTVITVQGRRDEDRIRKIFSESRGDFRISLLYSYNEQTDTTEIHLVPILVAEERIGVENGKLLNTRTEFELDKFAMPTKYLRNTEAFIEEVWMPAKKELAKYNVTLPIIIDHGDYYAFELVTSSEYCEKGERKSIWGSKKVRPANVDFRNKAMMECKMYIINYFANYIEEAPRANALAEAIDVISREIGSEVCNGPEIIEIDGNETATATV